MIIMIQQNDIISIPQDKELTFEEKLKLKESSIILNRLPEIIKMQKEITELEKYCKEFKENYITDKNLQNILGFGNNREAYQALNIEIKQIDSKTEIKSINDIENLKMYKTRLQSLKNFFDNNISITIKIIDIIDKIRKFKIARIIEKDEFLTMSKQFSFKIDSFKNQTLVLFIGFNNINDDLSLIEKSGGLNYNLNMIMPTKANLEILENMLKYIEDEYLHG